MAFTIQLCRTGTVESLWCGSQSRFSDGHVLLLEPVRDLITLHRPATNPYTIPPSLPEPEVFVELFLLKRSGGRRSSAILTVVCASLVRHVSQHPPEVSISFGWTSAWLPLLVSEWVDETAVPGILSVTSCPTIAGRELVWCPCRRS